MKCLLDTHALLWSLFEPQNLSSRVRGLLLDENNDILVSPVVFWEISLKYSKGKLELEGVTPGELPEYVANSGFDILPLAPSDAATFHALPKTAHKDPFDRMLVWQAIRNGLTLISKDKGIRAYEAHGLRVIW